MTKFNVKCSMCGEFHNRFKRSGYCARCHARYMREWRKQQKPAAVDTRELRELAGFHLRSQLRQMQRLKANARAYVNSYLKRGKIQKEPCLCGEPAVHMHHHDYTKPLEVTWMCQACHTYHHKVERVSREIAAAILS